jgi:hypothetical protein
MAHNARRRPAIGGVSNVTVGEDVDAASVPQAAVIGGAR